MVIGHKFLQQDEPTHDGAFVLELIARFSRMLRLLRSHFIDLDKQRGHL